MSSEQSAQEPVDGQSDSKPSAITRAVRWALSVNPSECRKKAVGLLRRYLQVGPSSGAQGGGGHSNGPTDRDIRRRIAEKVVGEFAKKGAAAGFITGMPANIAASVPMAIADTGTLLHFYSTINAMVGYLADPNYYEQENWQDDIIIILAGASQILRELAIEGEKHTAKTLIKQHIRKGALKALQRWILKWFGKKLTQRAIITKTVPIIGGGIGGTWNYFEVTIIGKRIIKYHFDELLN